MEKQTGWENGQNPDIQNRPVTWCIALFTVLGFDTGFSAQNLHSLRAGHLEKAFTAPNYVLKNPVFLSSIDEIVKYINIKFMIIPIRNYEDAARSRANRGVEANGGLWNAHDSESQVAFYKDLLADYLVTMVQNDIPTVFLDFNEMTKKPEYMYLKLKPIFLSEDRFTNLTLESFIEETFPLYNLEQI